MGMVKAVKIAAYKVIFSVYGKFHSIQKQVLFSSFYGKQYSDNPRAISEKLHLLYPDIQIVWHINNPERLKSELPDYVRVITSENRNNYKEILKSACYITNEPMTQFITKKKGQFFIQTWHGDRGFKKVLYDQDVPEDQKINVCDNKLTDLCIAGSEFGEKIYRTAFRYNGEVLNIGMPRNERMLSCINKTDEIRKKLGINGDRKILLYAPTFRDNCENKQEANIDIDKALKALSESTGSKWICLVRAHSSSKGIVYTSNENIINASDYPDMAELLAASDFLITDYSSSACDFTLTDKPQIIAAFDMEEYAKNSRTFKVTPREAGFVVAINQSELEDIIRNKTDSYYIEHNRMVDNYYRINETGKATDEICRRINEACSKR